MQEGKFTKILKARKEILGALEKNKNLATENPATRHYSSDRVGYGREEKEWMTYDSLLESFGLTFALSLPIKNKEIEEKEYPAGEIFRNKKENDRILTLAGEIFRKYIEDTLSQGREKSLTAVEFGGPGSNLFSDFTRGFFRQTIGVCLKDIRNKNQEERDTKNNHFVVEGDILDVRSDKMLSEIIKKFGANKTDLIISRMIAPLHHIDMNPAILDRIIRNWYNILNENGLMFIQFTTNVRQHWNLISNTQTEILIEKWSMAIRERFPEIDVQTANMGIMRLHKKTGAPENLPPATQLFS